MSASALATALSLPTIARLPGAWKSGTLSRQLHVARGLARAVALTLHNSAAFRLVFPEQAPALSGAAEVRVHQRLAELYELDWRNVEEGLYPREIASGFPWLDLLRSYPRLALDAPSMRRRVRRNAYDEVPELARDYPAYYRRAFHYQPNGYFGLGSAAIYDTQVELLFGGTADVMRRQVIPPLTRAFGGRPGKLRLLDVACGTGNVLRMLATTFPGAHLYGVDLSPHYIAFARRRLSEVTPLSLLVENAENLPFVDGHFDAVTCVYLFHELPARVRSRVISEMARVVRPGGLVVLEDSVQIADAPELAERLDFFPVQFHEPFYRNYLRDDMEARVRSAGLELLEVRQAFISKVFVARKPG